MRCIQYVPLRQIAALFTLCLSSMVSMADAMPVNAAQLIQTYQEAHPVSLTELNHIANQRIHAMRLAASRLNARDIQTPSTIQVSIYPIHSSLLTPGKPSFKQVSMNLPNPIFLIGDDSMSMNWLQAHKNALAKLGAMGFIVNVNSQTAMQALQKLTTSVRLYPVPGNALAKWLHIQHYPIVIVEKKH